MLKDSENDRRKEDKKIEMEKQMKMMSAQIAEIIKIQNEILKEQWKMREIQEKMKKSQDEMQKSQQKMQEEMQEMKKEQKELKKEQQEMKKEQQEMKKEQQEMREELTKVGNTVTRIEYEHGRKIDLILEVLTGHTEKLEEHEHRFEKDEKIIEMQGHQIYNISKQQKQQA